MQTKTVGVVIPIYNVEKYLKECLDSVINQTYTNLEIILVNDGSTDENSLSIAKEYTLKDKRITLFDKKNGGQSTARNVGIEYFSGEYKLKNKTQTLKENSLIEFNLEDNNPYEIYTVYKSYKAFSNEKDLINFTYPNIDYIIFLDSDDYWELNCIEECVPRMDGVEVVWFDNTFDYEIEEKFYNQRHELKKSFIKLYDYAYSQVITNKNWLDWVDNTNSVFAFVWAGMINFSFLKKINLKFLDYFIHEDHHFGILLFLQAHRIYVLREELYHYRIVSNTTCSYDNKTTNIPSHIRHYVEIFGDILLAKRYHMLSSIFMNALKIIDFIKQEQDIDFAIKIEKKFFQFLYMYHFGLYESKEDPLRLIDKLKMLKIIFTENSLRYPEFYFYVENGTGVQRIKSSIEYKIGIEIVDSFKKKNYLKSLYKLYVYFKQLKRTEKQSYFISNLPYEAYPDYLEVMKIQGFLSYKIGSCFVNCCKHDKSFIYIVYKLVNIFKQWTQKANSTHYIKTVKEWDFLNKKIYPIFKEHDLVDISSYSDVLKRCLFDKKREPYWLCDLGYNALVEGIKLTFNKHIKKEKLKVYLYNDWQAILVPCDLFFASEDSNGYYINISECMEVKGIKIFIQDLSIELANLQILSRKTLGYIVSAKPDAFGMRLAGILVGMYLSRQINFRFAFTWENSIDVDFLNVQKSVKTNEVHYLGNAMEDATHVFNEDFIKQYMIPSKCAMPSWGHNLGFNKRSLYDLKYGRGDETWGWYSTDILPSKWIKDCDEAESLKEISKIYQTINFSNSFKQIINDVDLIYKKMQQKFVAIHIRGGEIIFSDSRKVPGWCVVEERYFPYEIALEIALDEVKNGNFVVIFGQDLKSNALLANYITSKLNNCNAIRCIDDFIAKQYSDMERSFFDMNFMSKAEKIYSAKESVFSKVSMMISGKNNLVSYHSLFNLRQQYDIIKKNLNILGLHDLYTAMAYFRLYSLSKQLGKNVNKSFDMIQKALEYDFENDAYRIYIIDFYLQTKQYKQAENLLKYVVENRKESFLKNFFENSCRSFNREYETYIKYKEDGYKYINYMKNEVVQWLSKI
ncbi:glycosyltransferase [Campylobacter coli]|nr:glycosyltransferase [Campylobacter coli]EGP7860573.1 glycosyltransferase [Campylobacter jejuni]